MVYHPYTLPTQHTDICNVLITRASPYFSPVCSPINHGTNSWYSHYVIQCEWKADKLDYRTLAIGLCRNFGGKPDVLRRVLAVFNSKCIKGGAAPPTPPGSRSLIEMNLDDLSSRHLMAITRNGAALPILFGCGLLKYEDTTVLIGSEFSADATELQLIQQINVVKRCMQQGHTVVLMNHDNIYEALYVLLI